jgi:hypothetical protein
MQESAGEAGQAGAWRTIVSTILSYHWTSDREKLEAFVLDRIEKNERALLVAHLEKCEECKRRVQEERELLAGIRRFGRVEMKRRLKLRARRDQGRRFEWTHAASLAAAIVIMLGAALAIRWFINVEQSTKTREIIISENKESKPGERALWIIGRIVEIKEKPVRAGASLADQGTRLLAGKIEKQSAKAAGETLAQEVTSAQTAGPGEELRVAAQRPASRDTIGSMAYEAGRTDNLKAGVRSQEGGKNYPQSNSISVLGPEARESRRAVSRQLGVSESKAIDTSEKKSLPAPIAYDRSGYQVADSSKAKRNTESAELEKSEIPVASQEAAKARRPLMAEEIPTSHGEYAARREAKPAPRKGRQVKNIVVRRGNMNDLPESMRTKDVSAVQTRLEKTSEGMVLTFYSNLIKDSVATTVEAIAPDSIIVTFRNKQIEYRIPEGLVGKM